MNSMTNTAIAAVLSTGILATYPVLHQQAKTRIGRLPVKSISMQTEMQRLAAAAPRLDKRILAMALTAYRKATLTGEVKNHKLTVIDYSKPSSQARMWIFDLEKDRLLFNTQVAHGSGSGADVPHHFSNTSSSHASSLGTYVTKDIYIGHNGPSLNLKGLEHGFNDHALDRRVVMHGAWYMNPSFIKQAGHAGRSWGCPAIASTLVQPVINTIKNGSVIFAYYPDNNYLRHSAFVA